MTVVSKKKCNICGTPSCKKHPCYPVNVLDCPTLPDDKQVATPLPDCIDPVEYCNEGCAETMKASCIILADGTTLQEWIDAGGQPPVTDCAGKLPLTIVEGTAFCANDILNLPINISGTVVTGSVSGLLIFKPDLSLYSLMSVDSPANLTLTVNNNVAGTYTVVVYCTADTSFDPLSITSLNDLSTWEASDECNFTTTVSFTVPLC